MTHLIRPIGPIAPLILLTCAWTISSPAVADVGNEQRLLELKQELAVLEQETAQRIRQLQQRIDELAAEPVQSSAVVHGPDDSDAAPDDDRFRLFGDFRLRYELNSSSAAALSGDREVLRGRIGAIYEVADNLIAGARIVTGDAANPRTADVTLSDFAQDLEVSLDQAYLAYHRDGVVLTGGKFPKPFVSTELVWDGDVNPQGFGASIDLLNAAGWALKATGIYFVIDEGVFERRSDMLGAQVSTVYGPANHWHAELSAALYDYDLQTLAPLTSSRARGNKLVPGGDTLLSDFDLFNLVGSVAYTGLGERWDLRFVGDYVRNLGAAAGDDQGFGFDIYAGNLDVPDRWLLRYGYAQAETDAVLGMFSHDNIPYVTNYDMHTLSVAYSIQPHTFVELTGYRFRRQEPDPVSPLDGDWSSRTRLNLYVDF